jgi:hypothetical protein
MGVTIQFESHRVELPTIFELEYDDSVLEYYDQASSIKLDYSTEGGRRLGVLHTPDFFVIRTDSAGWEECKTEEDLIRLSERNSHRYRRDSEMWICPPGTQYAERFGLYYRVRSSAAINWLFQRNIQFLEDYLRTAVVVPPVARQRIRAQIAARPACLLGELFKATHDHVTLDEIYSLIATGDIYVDLLSALLPEPEKVTVWLEKQSQAIGGKVVQPASPVSALRAGDALDVRQKRIEVLTGPPTKNSAPQIQERLLHASETDLAEATRRYQIVSQALRGETHDDIPPRTYVAGLPLTGQRIRRTAAVTSASSPDRTPAISRTNSLNKQRT